MEIPTRLERNFEMPNKLTVVYRSGQAKGCQSGTFVLPGASRLEFQNAEVLVFFNGPYPRYYIPLTKIVRIIPTTPDHKKEFVPDE